MPKYGARSVKGTLFVMRGTGLFQVARVGSIRRANQQVMTISQKLTRTTLLATVAFVNSVSALEGETIEKANHELTVEDCSEAKTAFLKYPFYSALFSDADSAPSGKDDNAHWGIEFDGMRLLIPQAHYTRYRLRKTTDVTRIVFHAEDNVTITIIIDHSADVVAKAFVGSGRDSQLDNGQSEFSIRTMFAFSPNDITCSPATSIIDKSLIDLMWRKGGVQPFKYPDPAVVILEVDVDRKNGFIMHEPTENPELMTWYSNFVSGDRYVTWVFRYPSSLSSKYKNLGALFTTASATSPPKWWPSFATTFLGAPRETPGKEIHGELEF